MSSAVRKAILGATSGLCMAILACKKNPIPPSSSATNKAVTVADQTSSDRLAMAMPVAAWEAQFINPGDWIDVVGAVGKDSPARSKIGTSQTVLYKVLVIAVRAPIEKGDPAALALSLNPGEASVLASALDEMKLHVLLRGNKKVDWTPPAQMTDHPYRLFR